MNEQKLQNLVEKKVPGLFYIIAIFAMIEFGILMICLASSGNQDIVKVYNPEKTVVYEDFYNTAALIEFKDIYGIKNFKDEGFVVTHEVVDKKFPTRSWIALSVCVPMVLILFIVFIVRVFEDVFKAKRRKTKKAETSQRNPNFEETRFERLFLTLGRLNVYSLGATIIVISFFLWMVPDLLMYLAKISYETLSELKWIVLCLLILVGVYLIIRTFLSYKTRTQIIKQQFEIQKNRDRLAIEAKLETKLLKDRQEGN
ncbi:MAG: hypothetical protein GY699_00315 [Desulfobacteraceae bacterium]|nr:hypothetical protein [Desulfobacteraceae bacterium]